MEKREAERCIKQFMDGLAFRYSYEEWHALYEAMERMRKKYGPAFVADAIRKDKKDAELALFRYYRSHCQKQEQEPEPEPNYKPRFHKAYPRQKSIARRFVGMIIAGIIALALLTMGMSKLAIDHSDEVIARADRILAEAER